MDHADHFIEAFAIDRKAAVLGLGKGADELVEAEAGGNGDDIPARDADVARGLVAEIQQVLEHLPLGQRQIARDGAGAVTLLGLLDRFLDLVAQGRLGVVAEYEMLDPAPQPRTAVVVLPGRHQAGTS